MIMTGSTATPPAPVPSPESLLRRLKSGDVDPAQVVRRLAHGDDADRAALGAVLDEIEADRKLDLDEALA
jgi:hypothetical protein